MDVAIIPKFLSCQMDFLCQMYYQQMFEIIGQFKIC